MARLKLRDFIRDDRGAVAIWIGIGLVGIFGVATLAVDGGQLYVMRNRLQITADSAAVAAATQLGDGSASNVAAAKNAATDSAKDNMPVADHGLVLKDPDIEAGQWDSNALTFNSGASPANAIKVTLRRAAANNNPVDTFLGAVIGNPEVDVVAEAIAIMSAPTCMLALEDQSEIGIRLDSNAQVNANGCEVHSNSPHPSASIQALSASSIEAAGTCARGGVNDPNNVIDPPAEDNCSPKADPLAGLQAPASASGPCMPDNEFDDHTDPLDPGVYCGGLKIDGNSDLVLNPGVYTIKNGQLFIGSNSRVTGTGVAFYLTGDSSTLIFFDSNAVIDLKAPQRGQPLAGILFYEDRNYTPAPPAVDPRRHQINSNTNQSYEGTVYLPQGELFVDSNGTVGTPSPFTIMIARRITADSNAMINMNSDFSAMTGDIPGQCTIAGNCGMLVQ